MKIVGWVTWEEGLRDVSDADYRAATQAVIQYVRETGQALSGFEHQQGDEGVPQFEDGTHLRCSFRQWGQLMYEAAEPEGTDAYGYCLWAWTRAGRRLKDIALGHVYVDDPPETKTRENRAIARVDAMDTTHSYGYRGRLTDRL